jgi:hypothetical protein
MLKEATMPLISGQQDQDGPVWEPEAADSRLAKTAGADPSGVFTSDLSVSEYVLLGEAGFELGIGVRAARRGRFEPLGFVVGSSIHLTGLDR